MQLFDYLCYILSTATDKQAVDPLDGVSKLLMSRNPPAAWYNKFDPTGEILKKLNELF